MEVKGRRNRHLSEADVGQDSSVSDMLGGPEWKSALKIFVGLLLTGESIMWHYIFPCLQSLEPSWLLCVSFVSGVLP